MQCDLKDQANYVAGKAKEAAGKLTGQEELELKGKLQAMGSEATQKGKKLGKELKETLAEKANDLLDELQDKKDQHDKTKEG